MEIDGGNKSSIHHSMCRKKMLVWFVSTLILYNPIPTVESLECFSCKNVHNVSDCHMTSVCASNENCFSLASGQGPNAVFSMGCKSLQNCLASKATTTQTPIPSIVGRAARNTPVGCDKCCANDFCNKKLCSQPIEVITSTDGRCHDDADYNCELVGSTFDICKDVNHAKTFCRKWCGLCHVVDGGWSSWSPWSPCDVTCATGQRTRARSCNNPVPTVGGLNCSGSLSEMSNCTLQSCPDDIVYFTVTTPTKQLIDGRPLFRTIEANVGGGYNSTSAQFVCPVSGLYHFYFAFMQVSSSTVIYCGLFHNTHYITRAISESRTNIDQSTSTSVYVQLIKGDIFVVRGCYNWDQVYSNPSGMFTGVLVHAS